MRGPGGTCSWVGGAGGTPAPWLLLQEVWALHPSLPSRSRARVSLRTGGVLRVLLRLRPPGPGMGRWRNPPQLWTHGPGRRALRTTPFSPTTMRRKELRGEEEGGRRLRRRSSGAGRRRRRGKKMGLSTSGGRTRLCPRKWMAPFSPLTPAP